jgi:hypothetical protein
VVFVELEVATLNRRLTWREHHDAAAGWVSVMSCSSGLAEFLSS